MILEADMPRETMLKREKDSVCAECGQALSVAWGGYFGRQCYVLRCGRDTQHTGIETPRRISMEEAGMPYGNPKRDRERRQELEQKVGAETTQALTQYERRSSLTRKEAEEIVMTVWPGAPKLQVYRAAGICAAYRLNPLMGHVFLIPFNRKDKQGNIIGQDWAVVLSSKADWLLATRRGPISYVGDTPRVMTSEEQTATFGQADTDRTWVVVRLKDPGTAAEVTGYGFWLKKDGIKGADKGNTAFNMARIRAERQALQRLRPGEMPTDTEVADEKYIEAEYREVDHATGEIKGPEGDGQEPAGEPPEREEPPRSPTKAGFVDLPWLENSLKALQAKKLKAWTNAAIVHYLEETYNVTGQSLTEAVARLTKEQAQEFTGRIQQTLEVA